MTGRILSIKDVTRETSLSRTTIWRMMKSGTCPPSRKLSPQRVGWSEDDVEAWKASRFEHNQS